MPDDEVHRARRVSTGQRHRFLLFHNVVLRSNSRMRTLSDQRVNFGFS